MLNCYARHNHASLDSGQRTVTHNPRRLLSTGLLAAAAEAVPGLTQPQARHPMSRGQVASRHSLADPMVPGSLGPMHRGRGELQKGSAQGCAAGSMTHNGSAATLRRGCCWTGKARQMRIGGGQSAQLDRGWLMPPKRRRIRSRSQSHVQPQAMLHHANLDPQLVPTR